MSVMPHASTAPPLRVSVNGVAREVTGTRGRLGKLRFVHADDAWHVVDDGLSGGLFDRGEPVRWLRLEPGTTHLTVGSSDGPSIIIEIDDDEPAFPGAPTPVRADVRPTLVAERIRVESVDGHVILNGASVALEPGTLTAVIGPSGAGKTTLLRALAGQLPVTSGAVRWRGTDVHTEQAALRSLIGLVPQEEIQHPQLSVRRSLEFAAELRLPAGTTDETRRHRVISVIRQVGLERQQRNRIGSQLSGGQRKRVSIATELLTAPPLLFLDEPTSGLDPGRERQIMHQLRELAADDRVVVVATHSVLGLDLVDQVVVMARGGGVVHVGAPDSLLEAFGCDDYPALFDILESPDDTLPAPPQTPSLRMVARGRTVPPTLRSPFQQWRTLLRRNVAVLFSDRLLLTMLLAMPLVLGGLSRVVQGDNGLVTERATSLFGAEAGQRLTILVIAAALMGCAMTIRDLVHERAIYRREYAVGLSPGAYFASKAAVFGSVCFVQGVVVTWLALVGLPQHHGVHGWGWLEVAIPIGLLATTMALVGLGLSALARTVEQAAPLLVAAVMVQIVLSDTLVRLHDRAVLDQLSWLAPSRWAYGSSTASVVPKPEAVIGIDLPGSIWAQDLLGLLVLLVIAGWLGAKAVRRVR